MTAKARTPKSYHLARLRLWGAMTLAHVFLPLLFIHLGGGPALETLAGRVTSQPPLIWVWTALSWYALLAAARLGPAYWSGHALEARYSMTRQTPLGWAADEAKRLLLGALFFVLTAGGLAWLSLRFPDAWWWLAALASFSLSVLLTAVFPVVFLPMFYRSRRLEDGPLRARLSQLCRRIGLERADLRRLELGRKTVRANAAVTGLGGSRRIYLSDTLIESHSPEEVEMVLAHELGHDRMRHLGIGLAASLAGSFAGLGLLKLLSGPLCRWAGADGLWDAAALPLVWWIVYLGNLLTTPAANILSRELERQADRYALRLIPSPEVFRSMLTRLSERNLADPDPHPLVEWALYSHPSLRRRLRAALGSS